MEGFWQASLEEIKAGYVYDAAAEEYVCLLCGETFVKGVIYREEDMFFEAEKFAKLHIEQEHSSVLEHLLGLGKKVTGLTELQSQLLNFFYQGYSDSEIVNELDGGSTSTIRNHRFTLREKEKQAKVFLAIMELINSRSTKKQRQVNKPGQQDETSAILERYFPEGVEGPLCDFPNKQKRQHVILHQLITRFDPNRVYTEREVNDILQATWHDYVKLRRYLIELGLLDRKDDGSAYWVAQESKEAQEMDKQKRTEIKMNYKETTQPTGIYQIRNLVNGKVFVGKSKNVEGAFNREKFTLKFGGNKNKELSREWQEYGEDHFVFEVLELLKPKEGPGYKVDDELDALEAKWLEQLKPYGDRGYNKQ